MEWEFPQPMSTIQIQEVQFRVGESISAILEKAIWEAISWEDCCAEWNEHCAYCIALLHTKGGGGKKNHSHKSCRHFSFSFLTFSLSWRRSLFLSANILYSQHPFSALDGPSQEKEEKVEITVKYEQRHSSDRYTYI